MSFIVFLADECYQLFKELDTTTIEQLIVYIIETWQFTFTRGYTHKLINTFNLDAKYDTEKYEPCFYSLYLKQRVQIEKLVWHTLTKQTHVYPNTIISRKLKECVSNIMTHIKQELIIKKSYTDVFRRDTAYDVTPIHAFVALNEHREYIGHIYCWRYGSNPYIRHPSSSTDDIAAIGIRKSLICEEKHVAKQLISGLEQLSKRHNIKEIAIINPIDVMPKILECLGFKDNSHGEYRRVLEHIINSNNIDIQDYSRFDLDLPSKRQREELKRERYIFLQMLDFTAF